MSTLSFLLGLGAAIGIGALVGLEREHRRTETMVYAGVRTFPLVAVAGFLTVWLSVQLESVSLVAVGIGVAALFAVSFFYVRYLAGEVGFTTPMSLFVTYLAGGLIALDRLIEAVVVAVATTLLLLTKERLHRYAEMMDKDEIMGAVQFVALAFVALPLVAAAQGPWLGGLVGEGRAIDPQWTLFIVVAASSLAFASFLALRALGSRYGFTAAGALGGLVNSEAATASAGTLAKGNPSLTNGAAAAVVAATATMLARNVVLAGLAAPTLGMAKGLALVLAIPVAVFVVATVLIGRRAPDEAPPEDLGLESPFALKPALVFALVFTAVNAFAFFAKDVAGVWGVYATSIGALVSSGAVVASAANLVFTGTVSLEVGLITASLASAISIAVKLGVLGVTNRALIGRVAVPVIGGIVGVAIGLGLVLW